MHVSRAVRSGHSLVRIGVMVRRSQWDAISENPMVETSVYDLQDLLGIKKHINTQIYDITYDHVLKCIRIEN